MLPGFFLGGWFAEKHHLSLCRAKTGHVNQPKSPIPGSIRSNTNAQMRMKIARNINTILWKVYCNRCISINKSAEFHLTGWSSLKLDCLNPAIVFVQCILAKLWNAAFMRGHSTSCFLSLSFFSTDFSNFSHANIYKSDKN